MIPGAPQPQPGAPPAGPPQPPSGAAGGSPAQPAAAPDPLDALQAKLKELQAIPTWEDACALMKQDGPRGFRVDIETDSTVSGDLQSEQQGMTELLTGITGFIQGIAPAVESGMVKVDVAKALLIAAVRRFRMGKVVEDAIDSIGDDKDPQQPKGPSPEEMEVQFKQANLAFQQQQAQQDFQTKQRQMGIDEQSLALKSRQIELEHTREMAKHQLGGAQAMHDAAMERASHHLETAKTMHEHAVGMLEHLNNAKAAAQQGTEIEIARDPATGRVSKLKVKQGGGKAPTMQ